MLAQVAIFLAAAIIAVPLSRRLGLGAVLGYLAAGMLIGPWGLRLIDDVEAIVHLSEFGVILLLFLIGLELQPSRLWVLRKQVFGLGAAQVAFSGLVLGGIAVALGWPWQAALVAGVGLAMSSTAFVLQTLAEKKQLTARHGRESFAILLFQDLAVIPLLAALPFLGASLGSQVAATTGAAHGSGGWIDAAKAIAVIAALVVSSRVLIRPLFRTVATLGGREIFTATALFIVVGVTLLMEVAGLTASLGAFLAGMLLADSEYRHELEADIEPFKGLLMGLFFIAVGMSANLGLLARQPLAVAAIVLGMLAIKFVILLVIGRVAGNQAASARKLGIALAQGGEFAFVLFAAAASLGIFTTEVSQLLIVAVTVSMLAAPLLFVFEDKVLGPWLDHVEARAFDTIERHEGHVVVAGYGRVGQIITRMLALKKVPFIALEKNADQVDNVRRFGGKLYFGDATRIELLHSASTGAARLFVLAIDDPEDSIRCAALVRHHFADVPVIARAQPQPCTSPRRPRHQALLPRNLAFQPGNGAAGAAATRLRALGGRDERREVPRPRSRPAAPPAGGVSGRGQADADLARGERRTAVAVRKRPGGSVKCGPPMTRAGLPSPHRRNFLTLLAAPAALAACGTDALLDVRIDGDWFRHNFEEAHAARWLAAAPTDNGFFRTAFTRSWQPRPRQPGDLVGQARMIYVMAAGYDVSGSTAYLAQVKKGADFLLERFTDPMHGGWVEAVSPAGKFANENKRLYSQAFALFALAHAYRVSTDPRYVQAALAGWSTVKEKFADAAGGFRAGMNREMTQTKLDNTQNPVMHLFEALLALHDTGAAPDALEGARRIAKLVGYRLLQGHKDGGAMIPEFYDAAWKPQPEEKGGLIEIGHQFEWAYLLSAGVERGLEPIYVDVAARLLKFAIDIGHDKTDGGVFTSMSPAGRMMRAKGYWQQAEALRALMHHGKLRGRGDLRGMVTAMTEYIQEEFLDRDNGGWYPQSRSECQRVGCIDSQPDAYHMAILHIEAMRLAKVARA